MNIKWWILQSLLWPIAGSCILPLKEGFLQSNQGIKNKSMKAFTNGFRLTQKKTGTHIMNQLMGRTCSHDLPMHFVNGSNISISSVVRRTQSHNLSRPMMNQTIRGWTHTIDIWPRWNMINSRASSVQAGDNCLRCPFNPRPGVTQIWHRK